MTPSQIQKLREDFALSRSEFSKLVGVSATTVHRWEGSKAGKELKLDPNYVNTLATLGGIKVRARPLLGARIKRALSEHVNPLYALHLALKAAFHKPKLFRR